MAKRSRISAKSDDGASLTKRSPRDAHDDNRSTSRFALSQSISASASASASASSSSSSATALIISSNSTVSDDGGINRKKQLAECRLPLPKLLEMGVLLDRDDGGLQLVRPLRKKITCSDIERDQNRLLLPKEALDRPLFERMLTPAERSQAEQKNGLAVKVLDQMLEREYDLVLKFVHSIRAYRIMGRNYHQLVTENKFSVGQLLDLWLFRVDNPMAATSNVAGLDGELKMAVVVEDEGVEDAMLGLLMLQDVPPLHT